MQIYIDLDGFLYDPSKQKSLIEAMEENILNWIMARRSMSKTDARAYILDLYEKYGGAPSCFYASGDIKNKEDLKDCVENINSFNVFPKIQNEPETQSLIKHLYSKGYILNILTDSKKEYAKRLICELGIESYIKNIFSIEDSDYTLKKDRDFFKKYVLEKTHVDTDYLFDDNIYNIINANRAGFKKLLFLNRGYKSIDNDVSGMIVVNTLSEIADFL